ncbi:MAG: class I SAM-dependent methyltransferase [Anaerolineales bacterium]
MNLSAFPELLSSSGQELIQLASERDPLEASFLGQAAALARTCPWASSDLVRAALETAILRREAAARFSRAGQMYFTREALEQASSEPVARHRALRFRGQKMIVDLACGVGGDTCALSEAGPVLAVDRDALRLQMARENVRVCAPSGRTWFVQSDLAALGLPRQVGIAHAALYCDPSRRAGGRRLFHLEGYRPPFSTVASWHQADPQRPMAIKVSPGVDRDELAPYDCEMEFVSWRGELKEACLWFGAFRSARRRATLLPGEFTICEDPTCPPAAVREPGTVLYEPDPAVLRAGLVAELAQILDAWQVDRDIAYLSSLRCVATPLARAFQVQEVLPFGLKTLRKWLRANGVGHVIVKKRGSPIDPQALIHQLRLEGPDSRILFLTKVQGRPSVLVGNVPPGFGTESAEGTSPEIVSPVA